MLMKTLSELRNRPFYRFLKILYVLLLVPIGYMVYLAYAEHAPEVILWVLGFLLVLEVIKRLIYYIFLGTIIPSER